MTVDASRCPQCAAALNGATRCPACGLPLSGPVADQLWRVSVQLDQLERDRARLLARLRAGDTGGTPVPAPAAVPPRPVRPPRPRKEWTPERVQNVLLTTGAFLLVSAAIAFTAFAWGRLPIAARGAVMLGMTGVAGWSARWVYRRGLTSSAEAIALLTVLFGAVDLYAAHRANLGGLRGIDPATYWTLASGLLAAASAAFARAIPVRSLRYAALGGAQVPLLITAARDSGLDPAGRCAILVAQAALLGVAARRLGGTAMAARYCGAATWAAGLAPALALAYGASDRSDVLGGAVVVLACGAVALLWPGERTVPAGVATALAVAAALALPAFTLTPAQQPAAVVAVGLLAIVAAAGAPRAWRLGPLAVGAATVGLALAVEAEAVAVAALAPFSWVTAPWTLTGGDPAVRDTLAPLAEHWDGTVVTLAVVAVAALAAAIAAVAAERLAQARWVVAGLASVAVLVAPLGFATTYRQAMVWYVVAGGAGLAASHVTKRQVVALPTTAMFAVVVGWSLADEVTTLFVLLAVTIFYVAYASLFPAAREWAAAVGSVAAVGFAAALAASRGAPPERVGFAVTTAAFGLLAAAYVLGGRVRSVELVAAAAYPVGVLLAVEDPGWLAWTLGGGAVAAGIVAVQPARRLAAAVAAALAIGCAGSTAYAFGGSLPRAAFFVALAAAAAVGAGVLLRGEPGERVEGVAAAGYVVALWLALPDLGWLSWILAVGGLTALANALRPERRYLGWVATALLTAWTWDRLWLADVRMPEAYAAPVALLTLALGHLRRVREPETTSWTAYGRGLVAAFAPTCWLILTDPGVTRPVLLGVAGFAVLMAGVRERLQAPLAVGAGVLALDALVQLAPVAAAMPKWATIGAVGLAVIAVGVTYEDRRRDVARLRETFDALA